MSKPRNMNTLQFVVAINGVAYAAFCGFRDATSYAVSVGAPGHVTVYDKTQRLIVFESSNTKQVQDAQYWREYYNKQGAPLF